MRSASAFRERVPELDRERVNRAPRAYALPDFERNHLFEHLVPLVRDAIGESSARLAVPLSTRLERVGEIEHPADVVPLGVTDTVVADRVEHAAIRLALSLGAIRRGSAVCGPRRQTRLAQRVVQPRCPDPAVALERAHVHGVRPILEKCGDAFDVLATGSPDPGPRRQALAFSSTSTTRRAWAEPTPDGREQTRCEAQQMSGKREEEGADRYRRSNCS